MSDLQRTIGQEVYLSGAGLHTGTEVSVRILPAPENAGIVFVRSDIPSRPEIPAYCSECIQTDQSVRRTTLAKDGYQVQTVEHLMSALWGAGVDNASVEVSGEEMPGLDGSALDYLKAIEAAGTVEQGEPRKYFSVREPVVVEDGESSLAIYPDSGFKVSYLLSYPHPLLKSQYVTFAENNGATYGESVAPARTFCLKEEAEALKAAGFGKGANFENTLVLDESGVMNNTMRLDDECARHKLMDLIGDLFLLGKRLRGRVVAIKSGHRLNAKLVKKLKQIDESWNVGALRSGAGETMVGPSLDIMQIQKILPHRYPFLLIDRVLEIDEQKAVGVKCVTINDNFFQGHFPQQPVMPGVLIVEAMAQLSGVILLNKPDHRGKIAYFMAVNKVKFRKPVVPGDRLVMEVELGKVRARTAQATGRAFVDGKLVCEGELMFAIGE